jgi:hypothetical protein
MSRVRVVLANGSLVGYPQAGGLWTLFLQYPLGLIALGHDVLWLEVYRSSGDRVRDQQLIDFFFSRLREYGLHDHSAVVLFEAGTDLRTLERAEVFGTSSEAIRSVARISDVLWNFACTLRQPLLSLFRRRALIDGDPGHLQVSALAWDMGQQDHHVFLTVGSKLRDADCEVPTLGLTWHPVPPLVYLPMWDVAHDPGHRAPSTTVTQWNWEEVWLGDRVLSISKQEAYVRYVQLPQRTGRAFELAANIHPSDPTRDRDLFTRHGWAVVDAHKVTASPSAYRNYIRQSRGEISCPKPIFRELKTGGLSDRSACYLASGRPVLAEDTGISDHFPIVNGLVAFRNLEDAVAGVADIDGNYAHHSRVAREFAEGFLDSRRRLEAMLSVCDVS